MKINEFHKKYANIPVLKRYISEHYNVDGYTTTISPVEIYQNIKKAEFEISLQKEEIDRQLLIASQIIK